MGGLLILISVVTGTVAFISLIRPLPRFWLPTRKRAALVWIVSFVLLFIGAALSPNRDVLGLRPERTKNWRRAVTTSDRPNARDWGTEEARV